MKRAKKIILIGGSAGSYDLITQIINIIPNPIKCAVCIVVHRTPLHLSGIEKTLSTWHKRSIVLAEDKMDILENYIYFAPPAYHLLIEPSYTFSLDSSALINYSRPSIDVLFATCAQAYKENCTAFLLSGANSDGARGLKIIKDLEGKTFIQDPTDAQINIMPKSAIKLSNNTQLLKNQEILTYFSSIL